MKRLLPAIIVLLLLPKVALAQYLNGGNNSWFNGGTTLNAPCNFSTGGITASNIGLGTLQGNTTVYLPPTNACVDFSVYDFRATQAASQSYTLTVLAGSNTQCSANLAPWACCTGSGTGTCTQGTIKLKATGGAAIPAMPSAGAGIVVNNEEQVWTNNAVGSTIELEYVQTNPPTASPVQAGGTGTAYGESAPNELGTITNGNTATCNFANSWLCHATIAAGASITIGAPSNLPSLGFVVIALTTSGSGYPTLTWNSVFKTFDPANGGFDSSVPPASNLPNQASTTTFTFWTNGTNLYYPTLSWNTGFNIVSATAYEVNGGYPQLNTGGLNTLTQPIVSSTGADGPNGGGVLTSYGGTPPTCSTASGTCTVAAPANCTGSAAPWPNCSGSGAGTLAVSTNTVGEMHITGGTALTSATLTFSASGPWPKIPSCRFTQAGANATPLAYSSPLGGCSSTSSCVVTFVSASAADIGWDCH